MSPGASLWLLLTLSLSLPAQPLAAPNNPSPPPANPEVSWGDWLIVDEAEPGASILLRRITPKSVFIAPTVCSEGYRQDSMGRCVKVVKINQQAQWKLLLERLNSMYAPSTGNSPHKEAGPFHISLPIGSDSSQEDANVKKRMPPVVRDDHVKATTSTTTTTTTTSTTSTTVAPASTTLPTTTMTPESPTTDYPQTESTTERRDVSTERLLEAVMFGDQPAAAVTDTYQTTPQQLPEKPFVIIVTNKPTTRAEESTVTVPTTLAPPTSTETVEEETSETPATTEGSTETMLRITTDYTTTANEYDDSVSDVRPTAARPKCDPRVTQLRDDLLGSSDCEPAAEIVSREKEFPNPPDSVSVSYESNSRIRFPSESGYLPEQRVQSYVKFPEATDRERPTYWYPSWHLQDHPMIRGWPPSDQVLHRQYPPPPSPSYALSGHMWSDDANIWRRRFLQRD